MSRKLGGLPPVDPVSIESTGLETLPSKGVYMFPYPSLCFCLRAFLGALTGFRLLFSGIRGK